MSWCLYILECGDATLYTGITNDLERRIAAHEAGTGAKYTKGRGPFKLLYTKTCTDRSEASKCEQTVKALNREEKLILISKGKG